MSREQERIKKQLEQNPVMECNKIQQRFCGELFQRFAQVVDPRNQSYTDYTSKLMLGTVYYKGIGGIISLQSMNHDFNDPRIVSNICSFLGEKETDYLPHGVTINEYFARLDPGELQEIEQSLVYEMIRRKTFHDARFQKKWLVIVDGSQLYSGSRQLNDKCLERHYNKGTENETVNYHSDVLEAKIVFGEKLIVSIASEFIENHGKDTKRQADISEEEKKQDCETKAFKRLAEKMKKRFPRLPIILLADSLYASETVMKICREKNWDFISRYKTGSISSISEEFNAIPEKECEAHTEYINEIDYRGNAINMLKFWEEKVVWGANVRTEYSNQLGSSAYFRLYGCCNIIFALSNVMLHLPYIDRFTIFNLLLVPSTKPLL